MLDKNSRELIVNEPLFAGFCLSMIMMVVVLAVAIIMTPVKLCSAESQTANDLFVKGQAASDEKKYEEALDCLNRAIALEPNFARAYGERGNVYSAMGDYKLAIQNFNEALELDPSLAFKVYANRGNAYSKVGENNKAIVDFTEAIKLANTEEKAVLYVLRACAYSAEGQYDKALEDLKIPLASNDEALKNFIYMALGNVYAGNKQYDKAIVEYRKLTTCTEKEWQGMGYFLCGAVYYSGEQYNSAVIELTNAIKILPSSPDNYMLRGECYKKNGDEAKAQADFDMAKQLGYQEKAAV